MSNNVKPSLPSSVIMLAVVVLVLAVVLIIILNKPTEAPVLLPPVTKPEVKPPERLPITDAAAETYLKIAEQQASFLNSLEKDDGSIYGSSDCDSNKAETNYQTAGHAWRLLAFTSLLKATGDVKYLEQSNEEFSKVTDGILKDPFSVNAVLPTLYEAYNNLEGIPQAESLKNSLFEVVYLVGIQVKNVYKPGADEPVMMRGIFARASAIGYNILKRNGFRKPGKSTSLEKEAGEALDYSKELYLQSIGKRDSDTANYSRQDCWLELAKLEIYQATDDTQDLNEVLDFFSRTDFNRLYEEYPAFDLIPTEVQPCAESLLRVYKLTGDVKYRTKSIDLLNLMSDKYIVPNSCNSGVISRPESETSANRIMDATEAAYGAYIYSEGYLLGGSI